MLFYLFTHLIVYCIYTLEYGHYFILYTYKFTNKTFDMTILSILSNWANKMAGVKRDET